MLFVEDLCGKILKTNTGVYNIWVQDTHNIILSVTMETSIIIFETFFK